MRLVGRDGGRRRACVVLATAAALAGAIVPPSAGAAEPVIAAAGDVACAPGKTVTSTKCRHKYTSDLLVGGGLSAVLVLGDAQYDTAKYTSFMSSYDPTWGRVKPITFPAPGNHEYLTSGAKGYFDYFNGVNVLSGRAGDRDKGYYSFDIGAWHLIALNTSDHCSQVACGRGSPQETWLRADLAAHPTSCTLAFWHHPRFNSGHDGNATFMQAIFQDLYDANVDVVLGGHAHSYERFAPQDPSGKLDRTRGIRQFVVGTGGAFFTGFGTRRPNSEVRNSTTYGVLNLTLHPTSYDWQFVPEPGKSFRDSGSAPCHGLVPPVSLNRSAPAPLRVNVPGLGSVACTVVGTAGGDTLRGTPGRDVICGLGGDDRVFGAAGSDVILTGDGNDMVRGGPGADRVLGEAGRDRLRGGAGADRLAGGRGRDALFGGRGNDVLRGNFASDALHGQSGDDTVVGGGGRNRLYGERGDDRLVASGNRRGGDRVVGGRGRDRAEVDRGDAVVSVERRSRSRG
jgi:Ca2+-binding RTX toxin-like protein